MAVGKPSNIFWKIGENAEKPPTTKVKDGCEREGEVRRSKNPKKQHSQRRPSLKELCPEDKHRVRQLIEELVRVGNEKEKAEERLKGERKEFQELLLQLRTQHQKVVKEKQNLERELHTSQLNLQSAYTHPHTEDEVQRVQSAYTHPHTEDEVQRVQSAYTRPHTEDEVQCVQSAYTRPHTEDEVQRVQYTYTRPHTENSYCMEQPTRLHQAGNTHSVDPTSRLSSLARPLPTTQKSQYLPERNHFSSSVPLMPNGQRVIKLESILAMPTRTVPSSGSLHQPEQASSNATFPPTCSAPKHTHSISASDGYLTSSAFNRDGCTDHHLVPAQTCMAGTTHHLVPAQTCMAGTSSAHLPNYQPVSPTLSLSSWTTLPPATPPTTPPKGEAQCLSGDKGGPTAPTLPETGKRSTVSPWKHAGMQTYSTATQTSPIQPFPHTTPPPQTPQGSVTDGGSVEGCPQMKDVQVQACVGSDYISHSQPATTQHCNSPSEPLVSSRTSALSREKDSTMAPDTSLQSSALRLKSHNCDQLLPSKMKLTNVAEATSTVEEQIGSLVTTALLNAQETVHAIQALTNVNKSIMNTSLYSSDVANSRRPYIDGRFENPISHISADSDSEDIDDRPLSATELAVSLNLSTLGHLEYDSQSISALPQWTTSTPHGSMLSGKLGSLRTTSKTTYPHSSLFQCYERSAGPPDDSQVISDLFFI